MEEAMPLLRVMVRATLQAVQRGLIISAWPTQSFCVLVGLPILNIIDVRIHYSLSHLRVPYLSLCQVCSGRKLQLKKML